MLPVFLGGHKSPFVAQSSIYIQKQQPYRLQIPFEAAAGQYFVQILDNEGKLFGTEKLVIMR